MRHLSKSENVSNLQGLVVLSERSSNAKAEISHRVMRRLHFTHYKRIFPDFQIRASRDGPVVKRDDCLDSSVGTQN
jgi:hypothetical protein